MIKEVMKATKVYRKKLNVLGTPYTIKRVEQKILNACECGDETHIMLGMHIPEPREICLSEGLEGDALGTTIIHEILHAILCMSGVAEILEDAQEEAVIDSIATGLNVLGVGEMFVKEYKLGDE